MNIFFLNFNYPIPELGGTERSIFNISKFLYQNGYKIFVGYDSGMNGNYDFISGSINFSENDNLQRILRNFIINNGIEIVINFKPTFERKIEKVILGTNCKIISKLSFSPDYNSRILSNALNNPLVYNSLGWKIKRLFCNFYLFSNELVVNYRIKKAFNISEKYILLSGNFKSLFVKKFNVDETDKIIALANPLSFEKKFDKSDFTKKEKIVLLVGRMDEKTKRVLEAIQIWQQAFDIINDKTWKFIILGDGESLSFYKEYVQQHNISNIEFKGIQDPYNYYYFASFFMMTSITEGLANTLLESIQMGCIPIAYNNFLSLTDIITHNVNGIIISNNNRDEYVRVLIDLINNESERHRLFVNAIDSSEKFDISIIGKKWIELLERTLSY